MRKTCILTMAVLLLSGGYADAQVSKREGTRTFKTRKTPRQRRAERVRKTMRALAQPVDAVSWDAEAFGDLLTEVFREKYGIDNIVINWNVILASGANADETTEVTLGLSGTTVGELLDEVMEQVSAEADTDADRLTYHVIGGLVKISTRADFDRKLYTKAYRAEHLYISRPFFNDAPEISVEQTGQGGGGGGGQSGGFIEYEEQREEKQEALIEMLQAIRPDTWEENGGLGTITAVADKLVVSQTLEMHEIIGGRFAYTRDLNP